MTLKEIFALGKAGVVIGKIKYNDVTPVYLLPHLLLKFNWMEWPSMRTFNEIHYNTATNTSALAFNGYDVGLRLMTNTINGDCLSVCSNHPLSEYWLSYIQPIWDEMKKDKCPTCHGSGWDGETYTLSCFDCGGTGKPKKI